MLVYGMEWKKGTGQSTLTKQDTVRSLTSTTTMEINRGKEKIKEGASVFVSSLFSMNS